MDNIVSPIFWIGFICCLPPLAIGVPIAYVMHRNKQRGAGSEAVAAALGLERVAKVKKMWWYQGTWEDGRRLALVPVVIRQRGGYSDTHNRSVTSYKSAVRLVIELLLDEPLDVEVLRHVNWSRRRRSLHSFDTAFNAENGSKLTGAMRQALLDFARRHPGTLWLRDRDASPQIVEPSSVMAGSNVILLHEYRAKNPETETVRAKTAALVAVARTLEKTWRQ